MISATPNRPLLNVIQFCPETGELAGHTYGIFYMVCDDPTCDCGYAVLKFHSDSEEEALVGVLEVNVHERTLTLPDECPSLSAYIKETLEAGMQDTDWHNLERGYYLYKNILAEDFDVESLEIGFPDEVVDDPSMMQAYCNYLPAAAVFTVEDNGEKHTVVDQYCINPECGCTDVYLSVIGVSDEPEGINYNYRTKKIGAKTTSLNLDMADGFVSQLHQKHPDFDEQLAKRNRNMRSLFAKYLRKHKTQSPAPVFNAKKIGRNDPCICGSGRKYKNCCGKSR